ncbi:MAG: ABC transporter permease [Chloroflexi bacterium]|nr:ABC transporter permease [Chloroflexota bacterium]
MRQPPRRRTLSRDRSCGPRRLQQGGLRGADSAGTGLTLIPIEAIIGITIGVVSGYFGGWIGVFLSILVDVFWAFPPVVLALGIITTLGPGLQQCHHCHRTDQLGALRACDARQVQNSAGWNTSEASRSFGAGPWSILVRHIAPNVLPTSLVMATLMLPTALLAASSLSFLGFGAQPPTPEWGAILNEGREHLRTAPWISTYPGLAIVITVLGFNFLGDGLREALDPKLK